MQNQVKNPFDKPSTRQDVSSLSGWCWSAFSSAGIFLGVKNDNKFDCHLGTERQMDFEWASPQKLQMWRYLQVLWSQTAVVKLLQICLALEKLILRPYLSWIVDLFSGAVEWMGFVLKHGGEDHWPGLNELASAFGQREVGCAVEPQIPQALAHSLLKMQLKRSKSGEDQSIIWLSEDRIEAALAEKALWYSKNMVPPYLTESSTM